MDEIRIPRHSVSLTVGECQEAYSAFFQELKNPNYQYSLRLKSGDCLLMNNARILHGREIFNTNSGIRHLEVAYMSWDYFIGRQNFYQKKHLYLK